LQSQLNSSEKKLLDFKFQIRQQAPVNDPSRDFVLHEAKMTLLEAHNQRLETELIVSKTNWGELTNSLLKDINELERQLNEARNDCRMFSEEKDELIKRINEKSKGWSLGGIFKRKKRNSNIM
jgi:hypothetical protein